jgi:hypothetical protein
MKAASAGDKDLFGVNPPSLCGAGLGTCGTADLEVCATIGAGARPASGAAVLDRNIISVLPGGPIVRTLLRPGTGALQTKKGWREKSAGRTAQ